MMSHVEFCLLKAIAILKHKQLCEIMFDIPVIAQLAEHLTVEICSYQMVPGSIPGDRIFQFKRIAGSRNCDV